jgi:hypothetical protein
MTLRRASLFALVPLAAAAPRTSHAAPPVAVWNGTNFHAWTFFLVDPNGKVKGTWRVRRGGGADRARVDLTGAAGRSPSRPR